MTSAPHPLPCNWDGESFTPVSPHWARYADQHFVIGEVYNLEHREERSSAAHRMYFASINEAHQNLPEDLAERLVTPEHLRKWALIRCGYRDERTFPCASKAEALRLCAFIKPFDDFAVVVAKDAVVSVYTAKSQSMKNMGKREFGESMDKVLAFIASLIGTSAETLTNNAGQAA